MDEVIRGTFFRLGGHSSSIRQTTIYIDQPVCEGACVLRTPSLIFSGKSYEK